MKQKIIFTLLIAMFVWNNVAAEVQKELNVDVNYDTGAVVLSGNADADEDIYIQVLNPGKSAENLRTEKPEDVFNHIEIVKSKDGTYSCTYLQEDKNIPEGAYYRAYAKGNSFETSVYKDFYFANPAVTAEKVKELNGYISAKDAENIKKFVTENADKFFCGSLYLKDLSDKGAETVADMIAAHGSCADMTEAAEQIEKYSLMQKIYEANDNSASGKVLRDNAEILKSANTAEDFTLLKNKSETFLADLGKTMRTKRCAAQDEFDKLFKTGMCLAGVKNAENIAAIKGILKRASEAGILSIPEYFALSITDSVDEKLINKEYSDADSLEKAVKQYVKGGSNSSSGTGGGSKGGGGSSGGGGSYFNTVIENPKNTPSEEVKEVFTDVESGAWYYESVLSLEKAGCINGYSDGSFRPENGISRKEFLKIALSAFDISDENAVCGFSDVSRDDWCLKWIAAGQKYKIINGDDSGRFNGEQTITREDAAKIINAILEVKGLILPSVRDLEEFVDGTEIADYAKQSVDTLYCAGILNGVGDGMFMPKKITTRAETAKMIFSVMRETSR